MLLNSHMSAYARCLAGKVCSLVRSTWGTSRGEDNLGARDRIRNTKVARRARARQTFPHGPDRGPCTGALHNGVSGVSAVPTRQVQALPIAQQLRSCHAV